MPNQDQIENPFHGRWIRGAVLVKYAVACIPFFNLAHFLATHPCGDQRAVLGFFIPPALASLFILADNGHFERIVVRAAWMLLLVNAVAACFAEVDLLPIKAQFPGVLPPRIDRHLVYYVAGWFTFVLIVCPVWYLHWRFVGGGRRGVVSSAFVMGWSAWALFVSAFATLALRKLL